MGNHRSDRSGGHTDREIKAFRTKQRHAWLQSLSKKARRK